MKLIKPLDYNISRMKNSLFELYYCGPCDNENGRFINFFLSKSVSEFRFKLSKF